ncbi:MAG TPA: hypothetical protein VFS43_25965, partial [Polyangiaceae bacterium]|nr:hypothetical protein [Polyangiaceae bacterium]
MCAMKNRFFTLLALFLSIGIAAPACGGDDDDNPAEDDDDDDGTGGGGTGGGGTGGGAANPGAPRPEPGVDPNEPQAAPACTSLDSTKPL